MIDRFARSGVNRTLGPPEKPDQTRAGDPSGPSGYSDTNVVMGLRVSAQWLPFHESRARSPKSVNGVFTLPRLCPCIAAQTRAA